MTDQEKMVNQKEKVHQEKTGHQDKMAHNEKMVEAVCPILGRRGEGVDTRGHTG
jgi:hypothetical protein